jgi:hypothetical protein
MATWQANHRTGRFLTNFFEQYQKKFKTRGLNTYHKKEKKNRYQMNPATASK